MAQKKSGGCSKNGRDSNAKRLGVKVFGGQIVKSGYILVRKRGSKYHPGLNVLKGKDDTLFSTSKGFVKYNYLKRHKKLFVSVLESQ